jgi:phage tail-like protein
MSDKENGLAPFNVFRFQVDFSQATLPDGSGSGGLIVCSGAFSECTGLEATMEPFVIREGGQNYGSAQRAGRVTFGTVILKRGMTTTRHLWKWFDLVAGGAYAFRMEVKITMFDVEGKPALTWKLERAMPIKFKAADLNAMSSSVGIEELHLAHEGLKFVK